jgi:hypothetical protein
VNQMAGRFNPLLKGFFDRLVETGKAKLQTIGAWVESGCCVTVQETRNLRPRSGLKKDLLTTRYLVRCSHLSKHVEQ